jgi:lysophospholipase L1-like esterase
VTRGRWLALAVALVLVVAGVLVGVEVAGRSSSVSASAAAASAAKTSADCRRTTAQVRSAVATTVDGPGTHVAFLGDSYTSGYGLADPQDGYAYVLSRAVGWRAAVDGFPGSGFTTDATCPGERYAQRVDRIPADAALVLVEGGINDQSGAAQVADASGALLDRIHARVPGAAVVVVGPPLVPNSDSGVLRRVSADLARTAAAHGATYVDATGWSLPYLRDGVHPTAAGHRQFADLLGAQLAAAHLLPAPPALTP